MAIHWFGWLCFSLTAAALVLFAVCFGLAMEAKPHSETWKSYNKWGGIWLCALSVLFVAGFWSSLLADAQNTGLASRNTQYFKAQGFQILHAYGHKVCVAAGPYPLCLQERKDATGTKQLIMQPIHGKPFVIHGPESGFLDAIAHAPAN